MKRIIKNLILTSLTVGAILGAAIRGDAQTILNVDSTQPWVGYMNVFGINGDGSPNYGAYQFGTSWGTKDLRASFDATGTNYLTITACTNVWETTDTYWVQGDKVTPNKWMDASFYVQNDNLAGQTLTFNGTCLTNTEAAGYTTTVFIKDFLPNYASSYAQTATVAAGQPFSITLTTTPGDHIQYGFETQGLDGSPTNLTALGNFVVAVSLPDPRLPALASQTVVEGQTLTFSAAAAGTAPFHYQWFEGGNPLVNGGRISGATSGTLVISNITLSDAGTFNVNVTNELGVATVTANLSVVPLIQAQTNLLSDPSFESGAFAASSTAGWVNFNGAVLQNTGNTYYNSGTTISVLDGTWAAQVYPTGGGSYNGFYQDHAALPGQVYTASGNFYTSSLDEIAGDNTCDMEVQFRDAGGNVLRDYQTAHVTASTVTDTWFSLQPTNVLAGDFVTSLGTASYCVAPPNTASVRTQVTYYSPAGAGGSVYVDLIDLRLREPVVVPAVSGGAAHLSFPTVYGPMYNVYYKTNLTDASWQLLTSVSGDGSVKTVNDSVGAKSRFYIVNTQ